MRKIRFKGVENSSMYNIALGVIVKEGQYYNANLTLKDKNRPFLPKAVAEITIRSSNKRILLGQVHDIVKLYPPEQDLDILFYDVEELKK